jgi:cell division protein FtsI/penicillin-binding protein 2
MPKPRLLPLVAVLVCLCLAAAAAPAKLQPQPWPLTKQELAELLMPRIFDLAQARPLTVESPALGRLTVHPTLDAQMQQRAERILKGLRSRRAALVVVEAATGKVLALAGVRRGRPDPRVALTADSPAASLFKVVTAAAALEEANLDPSTRLKFVGRPHTLYKFQLKKRQRRKANEVTLCESFADSNNPIFARLGIHQLGGDLLLWYARALGFDRRLPFELAVEPSKLPTPTDEFSVGELACGYHRYTTMSPLHATLMISTFVAGGHLREPWVVERVEGAGGEVLYRGQAKSPGRLVSEETCEKMQEMFGATVSEGTARREFRRAGRDRVLKGLELGGKTGTLRGPDRSELFEWFAGYGREDDGGRALAVTALVVHGKVRYASPKRLARKMLKEAFHLSQERAARLAAAPASPNL